MLAPQAYALSEAEAARLEGILGAIADRERARKEQNSL